MEVSGYIIVSGLINGAFLSGIYILIALGIMLILSIMNILQFAHGEIYMLGAFLTYYIVVSLGMSFFVAMFTSMIATGIVGLIMERFLFRPFVGKLMPVICLATGLMLILQTSVVLSFGLNVKHLPSIYPGILNILSWKVSYDRLIALLVSIVLTAAVFLFLKRSRFGQAIIATAQHHEGALLLGINPNLMYAIVMGIGSALAAVAGSFAGSIFILDPFMGPTALVKGVIIIVLGGMGSLLGVIIGGIIIGFCDSLIATIFGSAASSIAPLIIVIAILLIKPQGLFGHE